MQETLWVPVAHAPLHVPGGLVTCVWHGCPLAPSKALRTGRRAVMPLPLAHGGCLRDALWHCLSWHRSRLWCLGRAADTGLGLAGSTVCRVGEP